MSTFNHALQQLPSGLAQDVSKHWEAFKTAAATADVPVPTDSAILEQLVHVWACSEFVAHSCIRYPELLRDLLDSGTLNHPFSQSDYRQRLDIQLKPVADETALKTTLRQFRRWAMVRIAWRDLLGLSPWQATLSELSALADVITDQALQTLYQWHTERFGMPRDSQNQPQQLVVLGMGKLGGEELNYSSDIDLIFAFPHRGVTDPPRRLDNEAFFRRLGQRLINALSEITADGFVFRVDMRLRPFGDSGALVMHFDGLEEYYQTYGRDWERYALIKARVIAGDRDAGMHLLHRLRPFVYRRYLDYGALEALRSMKTLISKEVKRKGLEDNIKLGPGGIREIEFIAQVFQLIYGGREPALQARSLVAVLDQLDERRRLPHEAVVELKDAYAFLRRSENCLQAWADQQTHLLPEAPLARLRLAHAMGFADWQAYCAVLSQHRQHVSAHFAEIFVTPAATEQPSPGSDLTTLWRGRVDEEYALHRLSEQGFADAEAAWRSMQKLKQGLTYRTLSQRARERMDTLVPLLLQAVAASATTPTATLEHILQLLEIVARRSVYLTLLIENPSALSQLISLCDASAWISRYLARYPLLLDELLDPASLYHPLDRSALGKELCRQLAQIPDDDPEQLLDALRHFKQSHVLRVAAADVSDAMPLMIVSDYLTEIAEVLLRRVLELAWNDLTPRFGQPRCETNGVLRNARFVIIAYGKLGGIELNYSSDLDLVFLHDSSGAQQHTSGGPREIDNATFFSKLVRRIIYWLTTYTAAGELYEVDMRLRPSGRAGLLVSSLDAFAEYQRNQAWTWEHQALVRARPVAGDPVLAAGFADVRREVLSRARDPVQLRVEVREMRQRMRQNLGSSTPGYFHLKQDPGGIADIEFMVQYAVLANAHQHPVLLTYTDNIRQLDGLEQIGILSSQNATLLRDAYRSLRRQLHRLTLQDKDDLIVNSEAPAYCDEVVDIWQRLMEDEPT